MADWPTIASLATAGGTLVLAAATYTSVRQGQRSTAIAERSTQIAERALLIGTRPVLIPARATDREERVGFTEGLQVVVANGMAAVEHADHNYYFAIPLHNVGTGLAVLHAWRVSGLDPREHPDHAAPETFRPQIPTSMSQRETADIGRAPSESATTRSAKVSTMPWLGAASSPPTSSMETTKGANARSAASSSTENKTAAGAAALCTTGSWTDPTPAHDKDNAACPRRRVARRDRPQRGAAGDGRERRRSGPGLHPAMSFRSECGQSC
jgi:hypothetical protein